MREIPNSRHNPTSDLINALVTNLAPIRRQRPPAVRTAGFLLLAAFILLMLAVIQGLRPDLVESLNQPQFVLALTGSVLTGVLGALAAFFVSQPGRSAY